MKEKKENKLQAFLKKELANWPTKKELADELGISDAYLSQIISGSRKGKNIIPKIAKKLSVSPLELMDNVTTIPTEKLEREDKIPAYRAADFLKRYASGGMVRDTLPGQEERPGEGESMTTSGNERERRVGILIENNTYQPAFNEGDVVIVDPDKQPLAGDLCLIILGDDLLIRRLVQAEDEQTIYALPGDEFRQEVIKSSSPVRMEIWGKATHFRRSL